MKIKHKKQLEVLWMEGSRRDPRKTFEKKKKNKFPEVLWMEGPAKSLWECFFLSFFILISCWFYFMDNERRELWGWTSVENKLKPLSIKLKNSNEKLIKNATYILKC